MTVDLILERLLALHPKKIDLVLDRVHRLLGILGHPELQLPPVIHVAGTNGKGSTLAFMRAMAEAAGLSCHVYTSPHLVRFNERIRLNGRLISDDALQALLTECEEANGGAPITFFEITTVAAMLAFARRPADVLLLEVGLGGRLDATNVIPAPLAAVITPVSMDHQEFLGSDIAKIAFEKAGIIKAGMPAVIGHQEPEARAVMEARATEVGAPVSLVDRDWRAEDRPGGLTFIRGAERMDLPLPALQGPHQIDNAALAIAGIRAAGLDVDAGAVARGLTLATWPARLQRIQGTGLADELLIDGGHNPAAAKVVAAALDAMPKAPTRMIMGLLANRSPDDFLTPLKGRIDEIVAVPMGGHEVHAPAVIAQAARKLGIAAREATDITAALDELRQAPFQGRVLIGGSLYLAGEALAALRQYPD
jgi:dihydrofolate synthase/folylpolyglutamate synthase